MTWRHATVLQYIPCLVATGNVDEALEVCGHEIAKWESSPDFFFILGNAFLDIALLNPEAAPALLPLIESSYERCLEIGDRPDLEGSHPGHGSHMAAHNLGAFHESQGQHERAAAYYSLARQMRDSNHLTASTPTSPAFYREHE